LKIILITNKLLKIKSHPIQENNIV